MSGSPHEAGIERIRAFVRGEPVPDRPDGYGTYGAECDLDRLAAYLARVRELEQHIDKMHERIEALSSSATPEPDAFLARNAS